MPFPSRRQAGAQPEDPEDLYRALAETNSGPPALWVHQGEILRSWSQTQSTTAARDVAIELPTGAGKTLVGGLIADFRRRVHQERAVIACPTRQLARQTAARLREYGVPNVLLVGRVTSWDGADRISYTRGDAVAVTVYSHIFNSNPAINDAQILIFDDAHAAEQYVAKPWSATIERSTPLYREMVGLLTDCLDPLVVARLRDDNLDARQRTATYLAAPNGVRANAAVIEAALTAAVTNGTGPSNLGFAMTMLQGRLDRAMMYVSHRSILIRPLIPPTVTHAAFASARQRVYMSATLGQGGELERAFGRPAIDRIPVPRGWDRQGSGRRFFVFPSVSTDLRDQNDIDDWVRRLVTTAGRALILTPMEMQAEELIGRVVPQGWRVLRAPDVEDDLSTFTSDPQAVLVLANRYDGIDLPDDDCRVVILAGLPSRGDLQERFLHDSLGAIEVLRERMRARFAQGSGRATRNLKDFAAVVILGDELINYVNKREVAAALHPELQAELSWGFDESHANSGAQLLGDLDEFFGQTPTWQGANADIIDRRREQEAVSPPGTEQLASAAPFEVQAWDAVWQGQWDRAVEKARRVIDQLQGGREVQRYAALWYYLLANWVTRVESSPEAAVDFMGRARAAGRGTTWLDHLAARSDRPSDDSATSPRDDADVAAVQGILDSLSEIGRNSTFDRDVTRARSGLVGRDARPYEEGLVFLGALAGAASEGDGGATAAPDAMWCFGPYLWISWEAKSEANPEGELGADDVRQAGSHLRYMRDRYQAEIPRASYGMIVTRQTRVNPAAVAVAEDHLYITTPAMVLDLFDRLVRAWRSLRSRPGAALDSAYEILRSEGALPSQWRSQLQAKMLVEHER